MRPNDAGAIAERIYKNVDPYTYDEEALDYPLLVFLGAGGRMSQEVEDLASDGSDGAGTPGWSVLLDVDNIPAKGLSWLGQFRGVRVDQRLGESDQRNQVRDADGQARGSLDAIKKAPLPYLTGTKKVLVRERDSGACPSQPAYGLVVITYTGETTDSTAILAKLLEVKPAGIIMVYSVEDGQDWATLKADYATWNDVKSHYSSWDGVKSDEPGI